MSNMPLALLLAGAVTIGSIGTAWPAPNAAPLPPGGAAGIKQAQGSDWSGPLIGAAITGGIFLAMVLLIDTDDEGPATTDTAPD